MANSVVLDPSKRKKYRSQKGAERASLAVSYIVLIILSLIWIVPILWIVLTAFRGDRGGVHAKHFSIKAGFFNIFTIKCKLYVIICKIIE